MDLAVPLPPDPSAAFELEALLEHAVPARRPGRCTGRTSARRASACGSANAQRQRTDGTRARHPREREPGPCRLTSLRPRPRSNASACWRLSGPVLRPRRSTWRWCSSTSATTRGRFPTSAKRDGNWRTRPMDASNRDARMPRASCNRASRSSTSRARRSSGHSRLRRDAGDHAGAATTLNSLGVMHLRLAQVPGVDARGARVEFECALDYFHQARELALQHADDRLVLLTEINIAGALGGLGATARPSSASSRSLTTARALGDRHNESLILSNAGEAARRAGQLERARELGEASAGRRAGDVVESPRTRGAVAAFAHLRGGRRLRCGARRTTRFIMRSNAR